MAKKVNVSVANVVLLTVGLSVAAVVLFLFLPAVTTKLLGVTFSATGLTVIFGGKMTASAGGFTGSVAELEFSILALLAVLAVAGAVVVTFMVKKEWFISAALYIVAAVLFFMLPSLLELDGFSLGIGAIVAGVISALNALLSLSKAVL